jgi:DNA-binding MarR family transcriptional regulator
VDVTVASQVLRTLQRRGLIDRTPHPTDTRAKVITVTPTGIDLATRAVRAVEAADRAFFSRLGAESKREMIRLMVRLLTGGSD